MGTGCVFGNLYVEKNIASIHGKPLSSCLSYWLTFLPEKQRLSPAASQMAPTIEWRWLYDVICHVFVSFHYCVVVVVTVSGNLYWKKSLRWKPENSIPPCERVRQHPLFTDGNSIIMLFKAKNFYLTLSMMHAHFNCIQMILTSPIRV